MNQDMRFKNKEELLIKRGKFPPQFDTKVSKISPDPSWPAAPSLGTQLISALSTVVRLICARLSWQ